MQTILLGISVSVEKIEIIFQNTEISTEILGRYHLKSLC
jgi:hypothetical protein